MSETEKITINMSVVDLGKIDLLIHEGLYTNRTDFIRTAVRKQIDNHSFEMQQTITRHAFGIGVFGYGRADLEKAQKEGKRLKFTVVGMLVIEEDVPPDLAADTIDSVRVHGVFRASDEVKRALADRTH